MFSSGWDCLPAACWLEVVDKLDLNGKTICRQVSRYWSSLTSSAIQTVVIGISDFSISKDDLHAAIARIRISYPRFTHMHLRLESRPTSYSNFKHLLKLFAASPALQHIQGLTISSVPSQTIPIPLTPLECLTSMRHLHLETLHNTYAMSELTKHLTELESISFNLHNLSTTPSDSTYEHTLPPLRPSLKCLTAHLAFSTSDRTLATIATLTNLTRLELNCSRHFATPSGLCTLASLTSLTSFHLSNFSFLSIPHDIFAPLSHYPTPSITYPNTPPPSWHLTWSNLLSSWPLLEELHVSDTNLPQDLFTALAVVPTNLKRLHLKLKYSCEAHPLQPEATQVLNRIPEVHVELHPHSQHDLDAYGGLLYSCSTLQSLRLVGVPMSPYSMKLLASCTSLKHLHIHFSKSAADSHSRNHPAMLTSALLAPLANLVQLSSCHITGLAMLADSLSALANDASLGSVVAHIPLRSFVVALHHNTDFEQWDAAQVPKGMACTESVHIANFLGVSALAAKPGMEAVVFKLPRLNMYWSVS